MSQLKFLALSGTTEVTQNMYVYEHDTDMLVVDCGIGFPDSEMLGVDLVIPDMNYVFENKKKLRGVLITHGHEDHIGAIPYLLKKVNTPVFASRLTLGFIKDKLEDHKMLDKMHLLKEINPENTKLSLGSFKVVPFRISHSVPDAVGFSIDSPQGKIFHVADYKFDWTPVDKKPFDVAKLSMLATGDVLALASDALGATNPGFTESELKIEEAIEAIVKKAKNRVYLTTVSSNINRMQQTINVAARFGRKIAFVGRSIEKKAKIAQKLGYLDFKANQVVDVRHAKKLAKNKVLYIIAGSYGQSGSALYRGVIGDHDFIKLEQDDTVVFSGDPSPPGSKASVDNLVDKMLGVGVDVHYYDLQENLHVSGHGMQGDIKMLMGLVKPKYFIPIGGTVRHMRAYRTLTEEMGAKANQTLELLGGDSAIFEGGHGKKGKRIKVRDVLIDGLDVGGVGTTVLRDRKILGEEGIVVVSVKVDKTGRLVKTPRILSKGFVYDKHNKELILKAEDHLEKKLNERKPGDKLIEAFIVKALENHFYKSTARRPMIVPIIIEV